MNDKNNSKPSPQYYVIKMEVLAPTTLTYRVLAESPEEALQQAETRFLPLLGRPQPNLVQAKKLSAKVYKSNSAILDFSKKY